MGINQPPHCIWVNDFPCININATNNLASPPPFPSPLEGEAYRPAAWEEKVGSNKR